MCRESPHNAQIRADRRVGVAAVLQTTQEDVRVDVCAVPINAPLADIGVPCARPGTSHDLERASRTGDCTHHEKSLPAGRHGNRDPARLRHSAGGAS